MQIFEIETIKTEAQADAAWADHDGEPLDFVPHKYEGTDARGVYVAAYEAARNGVDK